MFGYETNGHNNSLKFFLRIKFHIQLFFNALNNQMDEKVLVITENIRQLN